VSRHRRRARRIAIVGDVGAAASEELERLGHVATGDAVVRPPSKLGV
jgi:hypothetical protein